MPDDGEQLHLRTSVDGSTATLHAAGELDIHSSDQLLTLAERLCAEDVHTIVVDGTGLSFVDSAGLRALVVAHERATTHGIDLRVGPASEALGRVLAMTGLDQLLGAGR